MEDGEHQSLLQRERLERQWSRRALANLLGVSVSTIVRWESGQTPYKYHQEKICALFGMSAEQLGLQEFQESGVAVTEEKTSLIPERPSEQPSTYFVQDRSNKQELQRLQIQDALVTRQMGGVLAEQSDPSQFQRILDVGCGTGSWLLECARTYPTITQLVGVDISSTMVEYARRQAVEAGIQDRVQFYVMDALRMLEFPNEYFDLVNQRFGVSYLRTWDWPHLLREFRRVGKRGAVVRSTEVGIPHGTGSEYTRYCTMTALALHHAGNLPSADANSLIEGHHLLFSRYGLQHVQSRRMEISYQFGTAEYHLFRDDVFHFLPLARPFIRKWISISEDEYALLTQATKDEMEQADFVATHSLVTVWGNV